MRLPGFDAASSLYRTSGHYRMAVAGENYSATVGLRPLQGLFSPPPSGAFPQPQVLTRTCDPCYWSSAGCLQECETCFTIPCGPGQTPYVLLSGLPVECGECSVNTAWCDAKTPICFFPNVASCGICCPIGQFNCFGTCVNLNNDPENCGTCGNSCLMGEGCIGGQCFCPSGALCGGQCCAAGQTCFNGCCATNTGGLTLTSSNNYLLNSGCQHIQDLSVFFLVTEEMIATVTGTNSVGGFTVQLNAYSPNNVTPAGGSYWMQYIFWIHGNDQPGGNAIDTQVQYWNPKDPNWCWLNGPNVCGGQNIVSGRDSNMIPAGYLFEIGLNNDRNGNVQSASFSVTDSSGGTVGTPVTVPVPSPYQIPIVAFEVNVVGPDNLSNSAFSSGAGKITYTSSGVLCVEGGLPESCSGNDTFTGETSNANYGPIEPACCDSQLTQLLST
jgi:hypothetical protein